MGLYFLRARYLDVNSGRFWTQDSFEGFSDNPNSFQKYSYAHNNPTTYQDPSGHWIVVAIPLLVWGALLATGMILYDPFQEFFVLRQARYNVFTYSVVPFSNGVTLFAGAFTQKPFNSNGPGPHFTWVQCFKTDNFPEDRSLENQWIEDPPRSASSLFDNFPYYYPTGSPTREFESRRELNLETHKNFDTVFRDSPSRPPNAITDETWRAQTYLVETNSLNSQDYIPLVKFEWGFDVRGKEFIPVQASLPQDVKGQGKPNCIRMK